MCRGHQKLILTLFLVTIQHFIIYRGGILVPFELIIITI